MSDDSKARRRRAAARRRAKDGADDESGSRDGLETEVKSSVVTVSCPTCGAIVDDAEVGERTECRYCGTSLHVPRVEGLGDERPPPDDAREPGPAAAHREMPEEAPVAPAARAMSPLVGGLIATVVVVAILVVAIGTASGPATPSVAPRATPHDRDLDPTLQHADCSMACTKPCLEIQQPDALIRCMDSCEAKCKYVGNGSGTACRAGCQARCADAPDPESRQLCSIGCSAACPP